MRHFIKRFLTFSGISVFMMGCGVEPAETVEMCKTDIITPTGILLDKNKPLNFYFTETSEKVGVTTEQFLGSFSPKAEGTKAITSSQVIVDMSAGMNIGIGNSYDAIKAVMNRFTPGKTKYFQVGDSPTITPIEGLKSLSDAGILTNPDNFRKSYSKLKPALEAATNAKDMISIVITDFLLDEGVKGGQRLKTGKYTQTETANNSTWAKDYFTVWFSGGNTMTVYPLKYAAKNYYGKNENKTIYYIIFEPKGAANADLDNLKKDLANSGLFKDIIRLDPAAIQLNFDADSNPGDCVEDYKTLKGTTNKKALQIFTDYNTQHVPFSYPALQQAKYAEKPISCNVSLINGSPFDVELETKGYDATDYYYGALEISKANWDAGTKPRKDLAASEDLACDIQDDSVLVFKFSPKVIGVSYMSKFKGLAKLLLSKVNVKNMTLKPLHESLSWNFESKEGTMENSALKESLHLALDEYITKHVGMQLGSVVFSIHDKK